MSATAGARGWGGGPRWWRGRRGPAGGVRRASRATASSPEATQRARARPGTGGEHRDGWVGGISQVPRRNLCTRYRQPCLVDGPVTPTIRGAETTNTAPLTVSLSHSLRLAFLSFFYSSLPLEHHRIHPYVHLSPLASSTHQQDRFCDPKHAASASSRDPPTARHQAALQLKVRKEVPDASTRRKRAPGGSAKASNARPVEKPKTLLVIGGGNRTDPLQLCGQP